MGRLLERLREVETLEEALSLVDEVAKDITPDDVIEVGSLSDQLLSSDPMRAQAFAEIAARASERIGSWELRLRSQISKANALIARGESEEAKRILTEVVCESLSWLRLDLAAMALNNLSRALSDEERASRYRRASADMLRALGISDVADEATGLIPGFHPSTFGRRAVGPAPRAPGARGPGPTARLRRVVSPSRVISVAVPANWTLRFTPSPFGGFEDGFVAMDPEGLSYAVRTSYAMYVEPNSATLALVASMTGVSPAMLGVPIRPYTPPTQLLREAVTAILHLEQVEPVGEPTVSREPYTSPPGGVLEKATLAFKGKLKGREVQGEVTVYCVKFNPMRVTVGQDFFWLTWAEAYYGASPEGRRTAKAVVSSAKIDEAVLNRMMMSKLRRRRRR